MNFGYRGNHYCMPPDDDCMTEACCGSNIGRGEEDLLR
jgi:hypothetical protein